MAEMDFPTTIIAMALAASMFSIANWRQRLDKESLPGESSPLPLTLIQMACVVAFLVLTGHLVTLITGVPFRGRF